MLTEEEKQTADILGERAAKEVALDVLERLYLAIRVGGIDVRLKAMAEAYQVLYFSGRLRDGD